MLRVHDLTMLFAGAECGGTKTTVAILDTATGNIVHHEVIDEASNVNVAGPRAVVGIIAGAVQRWRAANPDAAQIAGLGVTAAGLEPGGPGADVFITTAQTIGRESNLWSPDAVIAMNDAVGAGFMVSPEGGCVLIAGTGSAGRVVTPATEIQTAAGPCPPPAPGCPAGGLHARVGGWGHLVGDEGSAYNAAQAVMASLWRVDDGIIGYPGDPTPEEARAVRTACYNRFGIAYTADADGHALPETADRNHVFAAWGGGPGWTKSICASFAADVARLAAAGDAYAVRVFSKVGADLGQMTRALVSKWGNSTCSILAVGSVWKSWNIFADEFRKQLLPGTTLTLLRPSNDAGAAAAAAWRAALFAEAPAELNRGELVSHMVTFTI